MIEVSDEQFEQLMGEALDSLPGEHVASIKNVAITWAEEPSEEQRQKIALRNDQLLYGLYEGVPLTARQGHTTGMPDKITLFKLPLCYNVFTLAQLKEQIRHTLWHEIAHYYGLQHDRIHELEQ
jgi:predicted Zn-dependent protease with MMP-like domain